MSNLLHHSLLAPARFLASASLMFFALPWLMVLLVGGTVAQRYIGLYASQKLFFGSFILWAGILPLPGAYSTLALIALSLLAKLLLKSELSLRCAGTLLVHVSAIVLLLGGLISALLREEGYVVLGSGQSAQSVSDYRQREVAIRQDGTLVKAVAVSGLKAGETYAYYALPFKIKVLHLCFPCIVRPRAVPSANLRGDAGKLELAQGSYSKDDSQNMTGMEIAVTGAGQEDGDYILYEGLKKPAALTVAGVHYAIELEPVQRPLPFSVRLLRFTKSDYPGTDEARAYQSDVALNDAGLEWKSTIEMNQPLRYKGYTLYQSSFVTGDGQLMSVLAVVKNAGEYFPYIAIFMLCAGLLLHIVIMLYAEKDGIKV